MADIFSKEKRSEVMSKIRGKNTKPELIVYRYLRKEKIYFQKHYRTKEGIVLDLALPRKKLAVFIDGDFWHGKTVDRVIERGPDDFWTKKITRNIERDSEQIQQLLSSGWNMIRIWESDLIKVKSRDATLVSIKDFLLDL